MQIFYDFESEKILLCQMILDNKIIPEVTSLLKPDAFYELNARKCFNTFFEFFTRGLTVNEQLFLTEFKDIPTEFKTSVIQSTYTASNWEYYAEKIRNCYIARSCTTILSSKLQEIRPENAKDNVMNLLSDLNGVISNTTQTGLYTYADMIMPYMDKLNERVTNRSTPYGIPTGFETLDDLFGGGFPNEYAFLAARPSIGKTALALQIANKFSLKKKVLFFELEMTQTAVVERSVMNDGRIEGNKLRSGFMTQSEYGNLQACLGRLYDNTNIIFAFPKERGISNIIATIRSQVLSQGIEAVFIDHIGLIRGEGKYHSNWEGVKEISNRLQLLQRELNIPFFILSQLNREAEGKDGGLANVAGSDVIVQDADIVMVLERQRQKSQTEFCIPTKLHIDKNRNFACGSVYLNFFPRYAMFEVDKNPPQEEE